MSQKEDQIAEEVRRRAIERASELEAQREQKAIKNSNLEALSAFDNEARDCVDRYPRYAEPGKTSSISIRFRGIDGSVTEVAPFYVDESPYRRCLEEAYQKTKVAPFGRLSQKVVHKLAP